MNSSIKEYENLSITGLPAIEGPGLESQRSRKRLFFHRKIFKFFNNYIILFNSIEQRIHAYQLMPYCV